MKPNSWGGAIELLIFSNYFKTCIVSVDVSTGRMDKFGQDLYQNTCYLIYSGIHYDALAFSHGSSTEFDEVVFDAVRAAELEPAVAELAKQWKKEHKFTDLGSFTLKCAICKLGLVGQKEAQEHAIKTSHSQFTEYS